MRKHPVVFEGEGAAALRAVYRGGLTDDAHRDMTTVAPRLRRTRVWPKRSGVTSNGV